MSIYITTDGAGGSVSVLLEQATRTFADMVNAISDEIDDTNDEYLAQIQNAIFTAIRFCEREPLYFNETCDIVFSTEAGKVWYDASDRPEIATLAGLDAVFCRSPGGRWRKLPPLQESAPAPGDGADETPGQPAGYSYFGQRLRLYPAPDDGSYQIRLQAAPVRFEPLKEPDEESPWFVEAFDLVKARAKYELYKDILKDATFTVTAFNDFNEQLAALRAETSRRNGTGSLQATGF